LLGWILDNNVPRGVTHLLSDQGEAVVEVREVLAADAPDADVLAYARAMATVLVTHDSALARRARALGHPCVWLRTREVHDVERLRTELATIAAALAAGSVDIRLGEGGLDVRDR
jgi:predicted nuclease of predicted toxin-antitoxin system